jgi:hypothetical protein
MSEEGKSSSGQGKPPRRIGCVSRAVYILIVAVLILSFAGGTIYLLWVQPVNAELATANAELEELRPLVAENEALAAEVQSSGTRLLILSALVDVNAARVSLAVGDADGVAGRLDSIRQALAAVESRLEGEPKQSVAAMGSRLALVVGEIDEDSFAAQRDLEVLANDLSALAEELADG